MRISHPAPCSSCRGVRDRVNSRYCRSCHARYMREHRPKHSELSPLARMKANARAYANVYMRRGKLAKQPCEKCGDANSQKHHDDYSKPLDVRWLCRDCHLDEHIPSRERETFKSEPSSCCEVAPKA